MDKEYKFNWEYSSSSSDGAHEKEVNDTNSQHTSGDANQKSDIEKPTTPSGGSKSNSSSFTKEKAEHDRESEPFISTFEKKVNDSSQDGSEQSRRTQEFKATEYNAGNGSVPPPEDSGGNQKKKSHKKLIWILVLCAAAAAVVFLIFYFRNNTHSLDSIQRAFLYRRISTDETGQTEHFQYDAADNASFARLNTSLLVSSTSGIRLYELDGSLIQSESFSLKDPVLCSDGDYAAVYDAGGQEFRLYNSDGKQASQTLESGYGILSARPNSSGWYVIVSETSGYRGSVAVYNSDDAEVIKFDFSSVFVQDAILSEDCNTVTIVTLGVNDNAQTETTISRYKVNSDTPVSTASISDSISLDLGGSDTTLRVICENSLNLLDASSQITSYDYSSLYLKSFDLGGEDFSTLLLGKYRAGTGSQILAISDNGSELGNLSVTSQVLSLSAAGSYFAVLTSDRLDIYDSNCQLYKTLNGTDNAKDIEMSEDGTVVLCNATEAWLYIPD